MTRQATSTAANDGRAVEVNGRASRPGRGVRRPTPPTTLPGTRPTVVFLLICAVALIPWTVGLALTLPARYVVGSWTLTWTGFDVALVACFALTAWALGNQRQIALPAAIFTSALLLCDAWFDLATAHGGGALLISATTAVLGEVPAAVVLATTASRLLRANARSVIPLQENPCPAKPMAS